MEMNDIMKKSILVKILNIVLVLVVISLWRPLYGAATADAHADDGDVVFRKNFGGRSQEWGNGVAAVSDGFVLVGQSARESFGTGDWIGVSSKGDIDAFIVKYNNDGKLMWKKNFGGMGSDSFSAVTAVPDGIVVVGSAPAESFGNGDWTDVAGNGGTDAIIVKFDNDGNVLWKKNFGGLGDDRYESVTNTDSGIIAVGASYANFWIGSFYTSNAIIVKYDNDGNVVWEKSYDGNNGDKYRGWTVTDVSDSYSGVTAVPDGVVAVGYSMYFIGVSISIGEDAIIVKYDNNGNIIWKKDFSGDSNNRYSAVTAVSDGIVAVGASNFFAFHTRKLGNHEDAIIVKYDDNGNVVWKKNYEGSGLEYYKDVTTVSDGVVVVGRTSEDLSYSEDETDESFIFIYSAIIVKYDDSGNVVWKKKIVGCGDDDTHFNGVATVMNGIVAVGISWETFFGNGFWEGVAGHGYYDAIIVKYRDDKALPELPGGLVNSVIVSPGTVNVQRGTTQQFTANVEVSNGAPQTVIWSVSGNNNSGTTISVDGLLTVASGETATTINVTATSTHENSKYGMAIVTVTVGGGNQSDKGSNMSLGGDTNASDPVEVEDSGTKTPLVSEPGLLFDDVLKSHWFYDDVYYVWQQNLMNGTSDSMLKLFSPFGTLTRGMVVTVLYRIEGEPNVSSLEMPFTDVPDVWYYDAIKWAAHEKIALGFGDGIFSPDEYVTREQMAAFISRYAEYAETEIPASIEYANFADQEAISDWAVDAVKLLFRAEIIRGREDNRYDPKGDANRAEFAAVLHRFLTKVDFDFDIE